MIVVCERCSTRFQLNEARLPARGAQVRCSRCKHAFFVAPPGSSADQVVEEVVAEATGPGGSSAPTVTTDLDRTLLDDGAAGASDRDEDEWEFNEDPPGGSRPRPAGARAGRGPAAPEPELDLPRPPAPAPAAEAKEASASLLDDLGDPAEWDFGGGGGEVSAAPSAPPAAAHASAPQAPAEEAAAPRVAAEPAVRPPKPRASKPRRRSASRMSSLLLEIVGYLAVALLFGTALGRVVERAARGAAPSTALSAAALRVTGSGAENVRVDFLENAAVGNIVVVSGQRTAVQPGTGLQVEWLANGTPIAGSATLAGPAIPGAWLREADPAELRTLLAEAAARPEALPGGAPPGAAFVAVYEAVPQSATALRVGPVPLPSPPHAADAGAAGPQGQAPAGAPSPSSPPSPPPSSG